MNKLIIGVGTGRCGTKSLTRLLSLQPGTEPSHERYEWRVQWNGPRNLWPLRLWEDTRNSPSSVQADVAFYWTPHVSDFLQWADGQGRAVRVVALKRDRADTIDSYMRWKQDPDHWRWHGRREHSPDQWDQCYPPLRGQPSKPAAIGAFWDLVYEHLESFEDERVRVFETGDLNTEDGVERILAHCGYDSPAVEPGIQIQSPTIEDAKNSTQWQ